MSKQKDIEQLINKAVADGKIEEKDRERWTKAADANFYKVRAALSADGDPNKALVDVIAADSELLKFRL